MKPPGPDAAGAKRGEPSSPRGPIAGVVLAGGAGRRLGGSKAVLRLPGSRSGEPGPTLVDWAVTRLAAVAGVEEIVVAAGDFGAEVGPVDRGLRVSLAPDGPGSGPAAGVLGAARSRPSHHLLVLACDLPLVPVALLDDLAASDAELAPATTDPGDPRSMNPTCALWAPPALERLAARIEEGDNRLYPLTRCAGLRVEPVDAGRFGDPEDVLLNVNTAADWERARGLVERESARHSRRAGG
ncbi:MAG: NTP transferase domain-containing protein [Holophagales bacterium]|nr:NTP transferase domain-containing protein [Holophagales bacterium]MYG30952.1 NTP transferase domain-containing protein [Holophagales bacterium]MYI80310.1 NTP transferase domain-containing protein [Holophagales bacterium]